MIDPLDIKLKVSLPPQACAHFDSLANESLIQLRPAPNSAARPKVAMSSSHRPIDHHFEIDESILSGTLNGFGNTTAKFFPTSKGPIGLIEEDYSKAASYTHSLACRPELRSHLSHKYIIDILFDWFQHRYVGSMDSSITFTSHLLTRASADIMDIHVAIPIAHFTIQRTFTLGRVSFDFYDSSFFDRLEASYRDKYPEVDVVGIAKLRKDYQGIVFAHLTVTAEKDHAAALAVQYTEQAITVLRFYSPTVLFPQVKSYFGRKGHTYLPVDHFFIFTSDLPTIVTHSAESAIFDFAVEDQLVLLMKAGGLDDWNEILLKNNLTDYEELLMTTISLFSKSVVLGDLHDKLVYILASLETIFLRDSSEPIQSALSQRLAFVVEQTPERRKNVVTLVKDAYHVRSSYLHHGQTNNDLKTVTALSMIANSAIRNLVNKRKNYSSRTEFLDSLEHTILT